MAGSWIKSCALIAAGLGGGLGLGAWWWRTPGERVQTFPGAPLVSPPGRPGGMPGAVAGAGPSAADGAPVRAANDRVDAVAAQLLALKSHGRESAMLEHMKVMAALGAVTGDECARVLALMEQGGERDEEVEVFPLLRWASVDPAAALDFALNHEGFRSSERILATLVFSLAGTDFAAAKESLGRMEGEERRDSGRALIRWMAQSDPAQAVALAREFGDAKGEAQVLADWARRDPVAAAAALRPDAAELTPAVVSIAENLARHDRSAFETWVATLTDPVSRAAARRTVLEFEAATDPAGTARAAAAWLAAEPAAAESVSNLTGNIAKQWAQTGAPPGDIAGWAASLPAGQPRDSAIAGLADHLVSNDPLAASTWLSQLPPSPGKDAAVTHLVSAIREEDPADAFVWATTIQEGSRRQESVQETLRHWGRQDPAAAAAAIEALPPEEQAAARAVVEKARDSSK